MGKCFGKCKCGHGKFPAVVVKRRSRRPKIKPVAPFVGDIARPVGKQRVYVSLSPFGGKPVLVVTKHTAKVVS